MSQLGKGNMGESMLALIRRRTSVGATGKVKGHWRVTCRTKDGSVRWVDEFDNIVVNDGLDHLLDVTLSGATQNSTWWVGLIQDSSTAITISSTDTQHGHSWTESTRYTEAARQKFVDAGVSGQSLGNSGSVATFSINESSTFGGAFLASNSDKGGSTATTHILYAAGKFASNKVGSSGDSLEVTATFSAAAT